MKKLIALSLILASIFSLTSCKTYLTPAILGHNTSYLPKPLVSDSIHIRTYASASYSGSSSPGNAVNFELGMLKINRSHTYKLINFSYGIMGYLGKADYDNHSPATALPTAGSTPLPNFNKSISGLGLRTSIGLHDVSPEGNTDYRLINWENSISTEMGSYASYRKNSPIGVYDDTYISKMTTVWTTGLSSEIAWHPKKNKTITSAIRLFLGWTPNIISSFDKDLVSTPFDGYINGRPNSSLGVSWSYYLQVKRISFTYDFSSNVNMANGISLGYMF